MDRLDAMSLLVAVAEAGSLSAASRKLRIPLPTVSRKISELEAHLNTRLLIRSTRRLALTDSGAAYLAAVKRILDEVIPLVRRAGIEMVYQDFALCVNLDVAQNIFLGRWPLREPRLLPGSPGARFPADRPAGSHMT